MLASRDVLRLFDLLLFLLLILPFALLLSTLPFLAAPLLSFLLILTLATFLPLRLVLPLILRVSFSLSTILLIHTFSILGRPLSIFLDSSWVLFLDLLADLFFFHLLVFPLFRRFRDLLSEHFVV